MPACFLVAVLLVTVLAAPAQAQSLAAKLDEARLAARVKIALAEDAALRAFTFQPTATGGTVRLVGTVEQQQQKDRAAEVAHSVEGVQTVVNDVRVGTALGGKPSGLPSPGPAPGPAPEAAEDPAPDPPPAPEPQEVYHTVKRGDTLGAIARRYGVSVREVQRLNGMRGSTIRIGQRLRVK